jgi:hypothetical protein
VRCGGEQRTAELGFGYGLPFSLLRLRCAH